MSQEIGLFYGSTTGMTEDIAYKIQTLAQEQHNLDITPINIIDLDDPNDMFLHRRLILGIPTWNYGEYQDDWEMILDKITGANLSQHTIALYGLGDQVGYPEFFLDALGMLAKQLQAQGATLVGQWSSAGYKFQASKALLPNGQFVGLGIDEDSEPEKTDERLSAWLSHVLPQLKG